MPEIARFYGIIVKLFFIGSEHNPPRIHVLYGEYMSSIAIGTGEVVEGDLPSKALALVKEWLDLHRDELMTMWRSQEFRKLPPLV
jgi:hypothetical protein